MASNYAFTANYDSDDEEEGGSHKYDGKDACEYDDEFLKCRKVNFI
jgi:hypothetical protein